MNEIIKYIIGGVIGLIGIYLVSFIITRGITSGYFTAKLDFLKRKKKEDKDV